MPTLAAKIIKPSKRQNRRIPVKLRNALDQTQSYKTESLKLNI